jgi:hypothetical protein
VAHSTPTNQKTSIAPIFVNSSAGIQRLKEKLAGLGVGGVFLTRGEWEVVAPARGEATVHHEAAAGALSGVGSATRGDAKTARANVTAVQQEAT